MTATRSGQNDTSGQAPKSLQESADLSHPVSPLSFAALGRWLDDYKHSVVPVLGTGIMALSAVFLRSSTWYWWIGFLGFSGGFVLSIFGAVLGIRVADRASELRRTVDALRDPKRVFWVTSALSDD